MVFLNKIFHGKFSEVTLREGVIYIFILGDIFLGVLQSVLFFCCFVGTAKLFPLYLLYSVFSFAVLIVLARKQESATRKRVYLFCLGYLLLVAALAPFTYGLSPIRDLVRQGLFLIFS